MRIAGAADFDCCRAFLARRGFGGRKIWRRGSRGGGKNFATVVAKTGRGGEVSKNQNSNSMINNKAKAKTIYVIGAAGRTGALFCRELKDVAKIIGVALSPEIEKIKSQKINIARGDDPPETFAAKIIAPDRFAQSIEANPSDFLWLTTRNPVDRITTFYYRHFAGKSRFPALILSQNGRSVIADAKKGLQDALGQESDKVQIIRVSLIYGIDMQADADGTSVIAYKLPIKLGFGAVDCARFHLARLQGETLRRLKEVFDKAGIKAQEFCGKEVLAMENTKLFLNLIGMYSAAEGVPVGDGWQNKEIFKKEIAMLREFVLAVKKSGGGFAADLGGYPVKLLAELTLLPTWLLSPCRKLFARAIVKGRNRPKDLSEIDYYNGEVVRLGKEVDIATPVNEDVIQKSKVKRQNLKAKVIS